MKRIRPKRHHLDPANAKLRRAEEAHLQRLEGNPLDARDIAMFRMFDREGWSHERRRQYIAAQAREPSSDGS